MDELEYAQWEIDCREALLKKYSAADVEIVVDWFRTIKAREELELLGEPLYEAMSTFVVNGDYFNLYDSLMARAFIYAPRIISKAKEKA